MQEYKKKHGITSLHLDTFLYYGVRGTNVLWNTPFCQKRMFSIFVQLNNLNLKFF